MKHAGVHPKGAFSLSDLCESVRRRPDYGRVGALGLFVGVVRGESKVGEVVEGLVLEAFDERADAVLEGICRDLMAKPGIVDVQIHHFVGEFVLGEDLVYVLVAGGHREAVFPVLEEAVERYKREAPVFKKETVRDGRGGVRSYWVSERGSEKK